MKIILLISAFFTSQFLAAQLYDVQIFTDVPYSEVSNSSTYTVFSQWGDNPQVTGINDAIIMNSYNHNYDLSNQAYIGIHPYGFVSLNDAAANKATVIDAVFLATHSRDNSSITYTRATVNSETFLIIQYKNAYISSLPAGDNSHINFQVWIKSSTGEVIIFMGDTQLSSPALSKSSEAVFGYFDTNASYANVSELIYLNGTLDSPKANRAELFSQFGQILPPNSAVKFIPITDTGVEELSQDIWNEMKYSPRQPLAVYDIMGNKLSDNLDNVFANQTAGKHYIIRYGQKTFKIIR